MEIMILHRRGMSIREIARELNCSRNTVRKYLRMGSDATSASYSRSEHSSKLDLYKPYLTERIESARPKWIPATVLLAEIRERGYTGGYSILKDFLLPFKKAVTEAVVRFETEPGEQMQADFTTIRRKSPAIHAFIVTMGWSRVSYVRFYSSMDSAAWLDGISRALEYFGGTPRYVLFDNAKSVILDRNAYGRGRHRWNPSMLALAEHYGFTPIVHRPNRARTKGKVERFAGFLKGSFVVPLLSAFKQSGLVFDIEAANAHIGPWLHNTANARVHRTTGEVPAIRLQQELGSLLPLPRSRAAEPVVVPLKRVIPVESIQHPLAVYQSFLEEEQS